METPVPVDLGRIAQDLQIRRVQVESVVQLLDEGNTVPFITRYRKERTGGLNEVIIREIQARVVRLRELAERKDTILKSIETQGKLTDELRDAIRAADNPKRLEDLYLPYKPKKRTKASDARDKGLEPLALQIWNRDEALTDLHAAAATYLSQERAVESVEQVLEGVGHILAESINELASVRDAVRRVVWKLGKIVTAKAEGVPEGQGLDFRDYFAYSEPIHHIPPHRILALNRGDKEGALRVKLDVPRADLERALVSQLYLEDHPHQEFFTKAALDALDRLLLPSLEREVRRDLTEAAERHAVEVFARNLRGLLLQPPIARQGVLAIDPGFRTGCKVAVLGPFGELLAHEVIHPHQPQNRRAEAKLKLKDLVAQHHVGVVAIGNGTACRETEELIAELIAEGTFFHEHPGVTTYPGPARKDASASPAPETPAGPAAPPAGPTPADEPPAPEASADERPPAGPENQTAHATENAPTEQAPEPPPIAGGAPDGDESHDTPTPEPGPAPGPVTTAETTSDDAAETNSNPAPAPAPAPEAEAGPVSDATAHSEQNQNENENQNQNQIQNQDAPAAESQPVTDPAPAQAEQTAPPSEAEAEAVRPVAADFTHPPVGPKAKPPQPARPPRPPRPKAPPPPPAPHAADPLLAQLSYVIVNEAGASVYSTSPAGRDEFPELDATTRSAISIGRRLQDPLAELVKIEPQNIGVGLYQHDVNPKQLKESLEHVVESCVNFVGVDLNSASVALLRFVSGLNALTAKRLFDHRAEHGPFTNREQLQQVEGIGPVTFTQAAGFLKVRDQAHPFDRTWVHPESYETARQLLERLGFVPEHVLDKDKLAELNARLAEFDLPAAARDLNVGEPTLHDICAALARPDRDPREDLPKPIFKKGVLKLEDLQSGMELKGTVLNVVDFGAFVDIGLKDSGLVHISQLANRYIKSPHDVATVGDVVTVWVLGVDSERKRVSLSMVPPGTERPRGGPGGGRRGPAAPPSPGEPGAPEPRGDQPRDRRPRGPRADGGGRGRPPGQAGPRSETPAGTSPGGGPRPAEPQRGLRVPGPPQRLQNRGRGGPGGGGRRFDRKPDRPPETADAATVAPRPKPKPSTPTPLSDDAKTGKVPLRTFGQLKQLYETRSAPESESEAGAGAAPDAPQSQPDAPVPPGPEPQPTPE